MTNPWQMGGGGGYWNPQNMMAAQGMGGFGGGYQPQMQQQMGNMAGAAQGDQRIDKLKGRIGGLQEQMKSAGSEAQGGIQARMDQMQGRLKGLRGDRRQGQGLYDETAQAQGASGGAPGGEIGRVPPGYGGGMPMGFGGGFGMPMGGGWGGGYGMPQMGGGYGQQMGGMGPWGGGGYRNMQQGQMGNMAPQQAQAPQMQGGPSTAGNYNSAATNPGSMTMAGFYDTPFGRLTTSSGGNSNVFKQQGGDENMLYHFDPSQGWKTMDQNAYRGYGDYNYADPSQYQGAGAVQQQFSRTNVPQNMLGRGFR